MYTNLYPAEHSRIRRKILCLRNRETAVDPGQDEQRKLLSTDFGGHCTGNQTALRKEDCFDYSRYGFLLNGFEQY